MKKITGLAWIGSCNAGIGTICVVTVNNGHNDKAYILAIQYATTEADDAIDTAKNGNKLPLNVGKYLVDNLGTKCSITY